MSMKDNRSSEIKINFISTEEMSDRILIILYFPLLCQRCFVNEFQDNKLYVLFI